MHTVDIIYSAVIHQDKQYNFVELDSLTIYPLSTTEVDSLTTHIHYYTCCHLKYANSLIWNLTNKTTSILFENTITTDPGPVAGSKTTP